MKLNLLLLVVFLKLSVSFGQQPDMPKGAVQIDQSTIIKDTTGNIIPFEQFITYMNSGEWAIEPKLNKKGELDYLQLRKATDEDKKMMASMGAGPEQSELIGKSSPSFKLKDIKGKSFNSEELKGKIVVVNLWFTSCKPCIMEMPELNVLYKKFKDNPNVVFLSITYNSSKEIKKFLKKHEFNYPVVASAQETCSSFNVKGYPTNIIIDQTGKFSFFATGGFPGINQVLGSEIEKLLVE